jgi:hypothetical protein
MPISGQIDVAIAPRSPQASKRGIDNAQVGAVALAVSGPLNVRGLELPAI